MFRNNRSLSFILGNVLLLSLLGLVLAGCNGVGTGGLNATPTVNNSAATPATTPTPTATVAATATSASANTFQVASVDMSINPTSIEGLPCGTNLTVAYTAIFHLLPGGPGGTVQFNYTTDNGRGTTPASLTFAPGEVTKSYTFNWSGQLTSDNVVPGQGGVMVTSPNTVNSPLIKPVGVCTPSNSTGSAPFVVTSIELTAADPLTGHHCGTSFTEHYNATFHIEPNGPGGNIVFGYSTNNGRGGTDNSNTLHVNPGQTTATYTFIWAGTLPADHTAPGTGLVLMSAPNQGESPAATPSGSCS